MSGENATESATEFQLRHAIEPPYVKRCEGSVIDPAGAAIRAGIGFGDPPILPPANFPLMIGKRSLTALACFCTHASTCGICTLYENPLNELYVNRGTTVLHF